MSITIPAALRRLVRARADDLCESCLLHQRAAFFAHQVDHIIARKHGGRTVSSNLALACLPCNAAKGSDLSSVLSSPRRLVRLFHPREDRWIQHFRFAGASIRPLSEIGEVSVRLLALNQRERVLERRELAPRGLFPSIEALAYLQGMSD